MDAARTANPDADHAGVEKAIAACVEDFYGNARKDPLLGPVFKPPSPIGTCICASSPISGRTPFLKTERYKGFPFPVHLQLPLQPEHFPR
jgi:hemoglobin